LFSVPVKRCSNPEQGDNIFQSHIGQAPVNEIDYFEKHTFLQKSHRKCEVGMKQLLCLFGILPFFALSAQETFTFPHDDIKQFSMYGNVYKNLAAQAMGSHEFEIWRSSLSIGSKTPKHAHETQEVFILLKGEILAVIGEKEVKCIAPATLICPANIPHQLFNIGKEPTDQILVLGIGSKIFDVEGKEIHLPWR
jgi:mannose-6-phosphate isomerase-like protein (cupin superfamily)